MTGYCNAGVHILECPPPPRAGKNQPMSFRGKYEKWKRKKGKMYKKREGRGKKKEEEGKKKRKRDVKR
jgi:hypothetical protein